MIRELIALENTSRVWIYQADRELNPDERLFVRKNLDAFLKQWTSHSNALMTHGNLMHHRFITLFVDESLAGASGCSIDTSVRFIQDLGQALNVDFFDRMNYTYMTSDKVVKHIHHSQLKNAYIDGVINDQTLFFDNLVKTKEDYLNDWLKPLSESWHFRFIK